MESLKSQLITACERSWAIKGYKGTSISNLTSEVNISPASFYRLFKSKELLFLETLRYIGERLGSTIRSIIEAQPDKEGFTKALIWLFDEYTKNPFLYDFNNPDFQSILNDFSPEESGSLKENSFSLSEEMVDLAKLEYRVEKKLVYGTIHFLLYSVGSSKKITENEVSDRRTVFIFLLENIINDLFL